MKTIILTLTLVASTAFADYTCKAEVKQKSTGTTTVAEMPKVITADATSYMAQIGNLKFSAYESAQDKGTLLLEISIEQPGNTVTPFFTISNTIAPVPSLGKITANGVYLTPTDKAIITCTGI